MSDKAETVIITKYSSRRLYDTSTSEYVTVDDLLLMLRKGINFKVVDKDSGKDITNQYLLQIITDLENKDGNLFPQDVLKEIILSYNNTAQKVLPDFLSKTLEAFHSQQNNFFKSFGQNIGDQNDQSNDFLNDWQKNQSQMFEKMMEPWINSDTSFKKPDQDDVSKDSNNVDDIKEMKEQISELQNLLKNINK
jgi:polyhydroxyalkanoate synthesis repressor PhaR